MTNLDLLIHESCSDNSLNSNISRIKQKFSILNEYTFISSLAIKHLIPPSYIALYNIHTDSILYGTYVKNYTNKFGYISFIGVKINNKIKKFNPLYYVLFYKKINKIKKSSTRKKIDFINQLIKNNKIIIN